MVGFAYMGLTLLDQAELDAVAVACAEERRWEFFVTAAPWRMKGATGGGHPVGDVLNGRGRYASRFTSSGRLVIRPSDRRCTRSQNPTQSKSAGTQLARRRLTWTTTRTSTACLRRRRRIRRNPEGSPRRGRRPPAGPCFSSWPNARSVEGMSLRQLNPVDLP